MRKVIKIKELRISKKNPHYNSIYIILLIISIIGITVFLNDIRLYYPSCLEKYKAPEVEVSAQSISPEFLGIYNDSVGNIRDIIVHGDLAYLLDRYVLHIVNVSDLSNPRKISNISIASSLSIAMEISGGIAYIASYSAGDGIITVNISDPLNPQKLSNTGGRFIELCVADGLAYCSNASEDGVKGVSILNMSDPSNPSKIGFYTDGYSYPMGIKVSGTIAYLNDITDGLEIIDVSDPSNPTFLGRFNDGGESWDVMVSDNYAYVADLQEGLEIIDISTPTKPVKIGEFDDGGRGESIFVSGNTAFLCDRDEGVEVIDISDPYHPFLLGKMGSETEFSYSVYISDGIAYIASGSEGLKIFKINYNYGLIHNPSLISRYDEMFQTSEGVAISGDIAYLADCIHGLKIINISDISNPTFISRYESNCSSDIAVCNNIAYLLDQEKGLEIVNVTDLNNPLLLSIYNDTMYPREIFISSYIAYIACTSGLHIINISNPRTPKEIGLIDNFSFKQGLDIIGNLAYIADEREGLEIYDISNPHSPLKLGKLGIDFLNPIDVFILNHIAYLITSGNGIRLIDISDPHSPKEIGYYNDEDYYYEVQVINNIAYIAGGDGGLKILNVSDPKNITLISDYNDNSGKTLEVFIQGNIAYLADDEDGLEIIDIGFDNDDDGFTNAQEFLEYSTNLNNPDTDNDSLTDFDEVNSYSTDPNDDDCDDDGLNDGAEINTYSTDPNDNDCDDDGLNDGAEINTYSTDPNDDDCDDDGLNDGAEINTYSTDPLNNDTDTDNLPDVWEIQFNLDPTIYNKEEDPDMDSLSNYQEYLYGTDPRLTDTDTDGYSDKFEIDNGYDPLDPNDNPSSQNNFLTIILIVAISIGAIIFGGSGLYVIAKPKIKKIKYLKKKYDEAKEDLRNFESKLNFFIKEQLEKYYGDEWWKKGIPKFIRNDIKNQISSESKGSSILKEEYLRFLTYNQYVFIITDQKNWEKIFSNTFPDRNYIYEKFENLRKFKTNLEQKNVSLNELNSYYDYIFGLLSLFSKGFNIFLSYSTLDSQYFQISEISKHLENFQKIDKVFFWEVDSGEDIVEYMERTLELSKVFILFCSENALKSKSVKDEWKAAFQLRKMGLMKIVPVYESLDHVPHLLRPILTVKYKKSYFGDFINNLNEAIERSISPK